MMKKRVATHPAKNAIATLTTPQHRRNDMDNSSLTKREPDARGEVMISLAVEGGAS
jgi:hypothetical protein